LLDRAGVLAGAELFLLSGFPAEENRVAIGLGVGVGLAGDCPCRD
jgi:hypothetical protein